MLPGTAANNLPDGPLANVVEPSDVSLTHSCSRMGAHLLHIYGRQFRHTVVLPAGQAFGAEPRYVPLRMYDQSVSFARCHSALGRSISQIVGEGAKEKVFRIYTPSYIAMVADHQPLRYWPANQSECDSTGPTNLPSNLKLTISIRVSTGEPQPAFVGPAAVNLFPKANRILRSKRRDATMCPGHDVLLHSGVVASAGATTPATSLIIPASVCGVKAIPVTKCERRVA